jgi:hypothetical protein
VNIIVIESVGGFYPGEAAASGTAPLDVGFTEFLHPDASSFVNHDLPGTSFSGAHPPSGYDCSNARTLKW